jgi:hypothetical protein
MKKVHVILMLTIVLGSFATSLHAQQAISGIWTMSIQGMSLEMNLNQSGDRVTGTLDSPHGLLQVKGEFVKGKLAFTAASPDAHPLQFVATANLNSDGALVGTVSVDQMEMNFTAVRKVGK